MRHNPVQRTITALFCILVLALSAQPASSSPQGVHPAALSVADLDGWLWNPDTGHYYGYYAEWTQGDWQVAESHAVSLGGHLVTINDAAEEAWLCDVMALPDGADRGTWIGFNNIAQYDVWVWASGEPAAYTNWRPGNPGNNWGIPTHAAALRYCGSSIHGWAELRSDGKSGNFYGHDYVVEKATGPVGEAVQVSGSATIGGAALAVGDLILPGQTLTTGAGAVIIDAGNPKPGRAGVDRPQYFQVQHETQNATTVSFPSKMEIKVSQGAVKTIAETYSSVSSNPPAAIHTPDGLAKISAGQIMTVVTPAQPDQDIEGYTTFALLSGSRVDLWTADGITTKSISTPCYAVDVAANHISDPYPYSPACGGPVEMAKLAVKKTYILGAKGWYKGRYLPPSDLKGVDCSGLVMWAYNKTHQATAYISPKNPITGRSAMQQFKQDTTWIEENEKQPGDLIFFDFPYTDEKGIYHDKHNYASHVVMYIGNGEIISAQSQTSKLYPGEVARIPYDEYMRSRRQFLYQGGFRRVKKMSAGFVAQTHSPVSLIVTDPLGNTVTQDTVTTTDEEIIRGIPGALYYVEWDTDDDGDLDAAVLGPEAVGGQYTIQVVAKPEADPTAVYGLDVSVNGEKTVLAENAPVTSIPHEGYSFMVYFKNLFLPVIQR